MRDELVRLARQAHRTYQRLQEAQIVARAKAYATPARFDEWGRRESRAMDEAWQRWSNLERLCELAWRRRERRYTAVYRWDEEQRRCKQ